jgi:hypothetical protein
VSPDLRPLHDEWCDERQNGTFEEVPGWDGVALGELAIVVPRRGDIVVVIGDATNELGGVACVTLGVCVRVEDSAGVRRREKECQGNKRAWDAGNEEKEEVRYLTLPPLHMRS